MKLGKYSFGIGDRFNHQGKAQLEALIRARKAGVDIIPVWNKSNREHMIVKSTPQQTRMEADEAVSSLKWNLPYFVDADHINLINVDKFIGHCDFFTIDVADYIGKASVDEDIEEYVEQNRKFLGKLNIPGIDEPLNIDEEVLTSFAKKFLRSRRQEKSIGILQKKQKTGNLFRKFLWMKSWNLRPLQNYFLSWKLSLQERSLCKQSLPSLRDVLTKELIIKETLLSSVKNSNRIFR
jgi:hypothetical protein